MHARRLRLLAAVALGGATLVLGGCVYLRLLAMKWQFADFDRHFTIQDTDGLRLICRDPVLLTDDFRWLGVTSETVKKSGSAELWRVRYAKVLPLGERETPPKDLDFDLMFVDGQFTQVHLPERFFLFVPKSFFVGLLRGLGHANVDRAKREADVNFTAAERERLAKRVLATSLAMLLGLPTEKHLDATRTVYTYHYRTLPDGPKGGVIDMEFTFSNATGQLTRLHGKSPVGHLSFNFEPPTPAGPAAKK